jgi:hypothetical protein
LNNPAAAIVKQSENPIIHRGEREMNFYDLHKHDARERQEKARRQREARQQNDRKRRR